MFALSNAIELVGLRGGFLSCRVTELIVSLEHFFCSSLRCEDTFAD